MSITCQRRHSIQLLQIQCRKAHNFKRSPLSLSSWQEKASEPLPLQAVPPSTTNAAQSPLDRMTAPLLLPPPHPMPPQQYGDTACPRTVARALRRSLLLRMMNLNRLRRMTRLRLMDLNRTKSDLRLPPPCPPAPLPPLPSSGSSPASAAPSTSQPRLGGSSGGWRVVARRADYRPAAGRLRI